MKVTLTINGMEVSVPAGTTIVEAARLVQVEIPTLCYLKGLNEVGACRICVVEVKGSERLVAACATPVAEGMAVETMTARVQAARQENLKSILSRHDCHCLTCPRNGTCELQKLAEKMGLMPKDEMLSGAVRAEPWDARLPLIRTSSRCISCLRCVSVCDKVQGMRVWDLIGRGARTRVGVRDGRDFASLACTYCGQCVTRCPVGALTERDDVQAFLRALRDPAKKVVVQVAPAVRAAWGEGLGVPAPVATERRLATVLRRLGAARVLDTTFAADLTVMEEGSELVARLREHPSPKRPLFTSCCPGWVRFLSSEYPALVGCLSSAKSPQQMFGAAIKQVLSSQLGKSPADIFSVSVMPCLSKKWEAAVGGDVDLVLTTREVDRLVAQAGLEVASLPEEDFDSPFGTGSGAGVIFGATGGVMEAALRTAFFLVEGKNPAPDAFAAVRGMEGRREVTVTLGGRMVRACVVHGLANARQLVEDVLAGRANYDFVEVMACPGGCVGGGGQPLSAADDRAAARSQVLYDLDDAEALRFAHENPEVQAFYREIQDCPLGPRAQALLHTHRTGGTNHE